jgi:hypothetical protein
MVGLVAADLVNEHMVMGLPTSQCDRVRQPANSYRRQGFEIMALVGSLKGLPLKNVEKSGPGEGTKRLAPAIAKHGALYRVGR